MYVSVHTDRSGRVFVSDDHRAAGSDGARAIDLTEAVPIPRGTRLLPIDREAEGLDRAGRPRALGRGRLALAAILPPGHARLLFPAYRDDRAARDLDPLAYAAVAADERGDLVVAAAMLAPAPVAATEGGAAHDTIHDTVDALRSHPANSLARQLARCAREHACRAARASSTGGDLPIPLGAPPAERPRLPVALRSGYAGSPSEPAAFQPTASEIEEVAVDHLSRGGRSASFGRACDGEPLLALRVMEEAIARIRARSAAVAIHLETTGADAVALRRAIDAGLSSVTVRLGSARPETYELLHGPVAHRWTDVRASLQLVAERGIGLGIALLVLPGVTDRAAELDAIAALLGELPGGTLELRDLGADPARALAGFPRARPLGVRALLARLAEADHFPLRRPLEVAAV